MDILDFTWVVEGNVWGVAVEVEANYGLNTDVAPEANDPDTKDHFLFALRLGENERKGDLSLEGGYAYNEPNSGIGQFMASDLGGAGMRGGWLRTTYNLTDFAKLRPALYVIDQMSAPSDADGLYRLLLDVDFDF